MTTSNVRPIRPPQQPHQTHELKCWPEKMRAIREGIARATARRCDDRHFVAGDRIVFVEATATGAVLEPRSELDAVIVRVERLAGDCELFGSSDAGAELVPFAIVHFTLVPSTREGRS